MENKTQSMIKFSICIFCAFVIISCENKKQNKNNLLTLESSINDYTFSKLEGLESEYIDTVQIKSSSMKHEDSLPSPSLKLAECNEATNLWFGSFQSLKPKQKKEIYAFERCINGSDSYELIWVLDRPYEERKNIGVDEITTLFDTSKRVDSFTVKDFKSYIFVLPLQEISDPLFDDPYIFPSKVKAYINNGEGDFEMLEIKEIYRWEDYVQFQYKCIFSY